MRTQVVPRQNLWLTSDFCRSFRVMLVTNSNKWTCSSNEFLSPFPEILLILNFKNMFSSSDMEIKFPSVSASRHLSSILAFVGPSDHIFLASRLACNILITCAKINVQFKLICRETRCFCLCRRDFLLWEVYIHKISYSTPTPVFLNRKVFLGFL